MVVRAGLYETPYEGEVPERLMQPSQPPPVLAVAAGLPERARAQPVTVPPVVVLTLACAPHAETSAARKLIQPMLELQAYPSNSPVPVDVSGMMFTEYGEVAHTLAPVGPP